MENWVWKSREQSETLGALLKKSISILWPLGSGNAIIWGKYAYGVWHWLVSSVTNSGVLEEAGSLKQLHGRNDRHAEPCKEHTSPRHQSRPSLRQPCINKAIREAQMTPGLALLVGASQSHVGSDVALPAWQMYFQQSSVYVLVLVCVMAYVLQLESLRIFPTAMDQTLSLLTNYGSFKKCCHFPQFHSLWYNQV